MHLPGAQSCGNPVFQCALRRAFLTQDGAESVLKLVFVPAREGKTFFIRGLFVVGSTETLIKCWLYLKLLQSNYTRWAEPGIDGAATVLLERFVVAGFFAMQMLGLYGKPISPPNGWRCVAVRRSKHWKVGHLWLNTIEQDSKIVTDQ